LSNHRYWSGLSSMNGPITSGRMVTFGRLAPAV
jgi:hypothetical protein